jgi:CheY-like chemotaxis protein
MSNLLLVESGSTSASGLKAYLANIGYKISVTVKTAKQAVENVKVFNPDFIVMDFDIKEKSTGYQLYDHIRKYNKDIPILYISAPAA